MVGKRGREERRGERGKNELVELSLGGEEPSDSHGDGSLKIEQTRSGTSSQFSEWKSKKEDR